MAKLSRSIGQPPKVMESADTAESVLLLLVAYTPCCASSFRPQSCKVLSEFVSLTGDYFPLHSQQLTSSVFIASSPDRRQ